MVNSVAVGSGNLNHTGDLKFLYLEVYPFVGGHLMSNLHGRFLAAQKSIMITC